jgi:hypothetical protein
MSKESGMSAAYNSDISGRVKRPLPEGTLVCFEDTDGNACSGRVKASGMYMLWVEDLQNGDVTAFIRYTDLVWVLEQE